MLAFAAVFFSASPRTPPATTSRFPAFSRPILTRRHCKKPIPEPSRPIFSRFLAHSSRPWFAWNLHALAAAALMLVLSSPLMLPAYASSIHERPKLDTPYPCQDVRRYYGGSEGLSGDELMTKLGAVVSPHASLRYKDVWEALKILDAADADNPEASSEVYDAL